MPNNEAAQPAQMLKAENLIALAEHHARATVGWKSSAELCINDASELLLAGRYEDASGAALRSLRYSIGILHADFRQASEAKTFDQVPTYPDAP